MKRVKSPEEIRCPCNPQISYRQCCQLYHLGQLAPSAEKLMRSRYSAYVLKLEAYLLETWQPATKPESLNLDEQKAMRWNGLTIIKHKKTGEKTALVEFIAAYSVDSQIYQLHETSSFVLQDRWLYVDGEFETGSGNDSPLK